MRAVIYVRVSGRGQLDGASLEDQERICREFAERQGLKVGTVYRDAAKSAWRDDLNVRPEFVKLLNDARLGVFRVVLVFKLDRFARKARIYHNCRWQLDQAGCQLLSATEPNDASAAGQLSAGMLAQFAEFYSAQLSERIRAAHAGKVQRGEWVGDTPFGYERAGRTLRPGAAALWVVLIFLAYAGGASSIDLAVALNATSIRLRSGKLWTKDSVLMVLHNRAYLGYGRCKALGEYRSHHPPLVTGDLWAAVHERLASRPTGDRSPSLARAARLDYQVRCAVCDGAMKRHTSGNGRSRKVYLRCAASLSGECAARGISYELVNGQVELLRKAGQKIAVVWVRAPRGVERWEGC